MKLIKHKSDDGDGHEERRQDQAAQQKRDQPLLLRRGRLGDAKRADKGLREKVQESHCSFCLFLLA